jgi:hypothetical protein
MDFDSSILMFLAAGVILQAVILYLVIVYAVRPSYREKQLNQQIDLLVLIAKAQGVPDDQINAVFNTTST